MTHELRWKSVSEADHDQEAFLAGWLAKSDEALSQITVLAVDAVLGYERTFQLSLLIQRLSALQLLSFEMAPVEGIRDRYLWHPLVLLDHVKRWPDELEKIEEGPPELDQRYRDARAQLIGEGAFGCVFHPPFHCYDPSDAKLPPNVVIKIGRRTGIEKELALAAFIRERWENTGSRYPASKFLILPLAFQCKQLNIGASKQFTCRGLAGSGGHPAHYYSEYGGNKTVADFLKEDNTSFARKVMLVGILYRCLIIMKHLRNVGVVHGDLTHRANIMLSDVDSTPRFIDFGSALYTKPAYSNIKRPPAYRDELDPVEAEYFKWSSGFSASCTNVGERSEEFIEMFTEFSLVYPNAVKPNVRKALNILSAFLAQHGGHAFLLPLGE